MSLSAKEFQDRRFPAHGEFSLSWHGRVLLIDARGPFNLELVRASVKALAAIAEQAPAGACVEVVNWSDSMMMPPDGLAYFDAAMQRFGAAGIASKHTLLVAPQQLEGRWLMLPQLLAIWQRDRPVELFEELDQALERAQRLALQLGESGALSVGS